MHLMRWQQLFPQIFLCSYPFPVHLKSIFVVGVSWKVIQDKTKLTLLTYVRSEEDDPLKPTPLDIYLLYYLLRGLLPCFLLLGRIIIKVWGSSPTQRLKLLPPHLALLMVLRCMSFGLSKQYFSWVFHTFFQSFDHRKIIIIIIICSGITCLQE